MARASDYLSYNKTSVRIAISDRRPELKLRFMLYVIMSSHSIDETSILELENTVEKWYVYYSKYRDELKFKSEGVNDIPLKEAINL